MVAFEAEFTSATPAISSEVHLWYLPPGFLRCEQRTGDELTAIVWVRDQEVTMYEGWSNRAITHSLRFLRGRERRGPEPFGAPPDVVLPLVNDDLFFMIVQRLVELHRSGFSLPAGQEPGTVVLEAKAKDPFAGVFVQPAGALTESTLRVVADAKTLLLRSAQFVPETLGLFQRFTVHSITLTPPDPSVFDVNLPVGATQLRIPDSASQMEYSLQFMGFLWGSPPEAHTAEEQAKVEGFRLTTQGDAQQKLLFPLVLTPDWDAMSIGVDRYTSTTRARVLYTNGTDTLKVYYDLQWVLPPDRQPPQFPTDFLAVQDERARKVLLENQELARKFGGEVWTIAGQEVVFRNDERNLPSLYLWWDLDAESLVSNSPLRFTSENPAENAFWTLVLKFDVECPRSVSQSVLRDFAERTIRAYQEAFKSAKPK